MKDGTSLGSGNEHTTANQGGTVSPSSRFNRPHLVPLQSRTASPCSRCRTLIYDIVNERSTVEEHNVRIPRPGSSSRPRCAPLPGVPVQQLNCVLDDSREPRVKVRAQQAYYRVLDVFHVPVRVRTKRF